MADLTVVILTYNEEKHIARALESVAAIAEKVFVIDSFSTDRTKEIAEAHGATVLQHEFLNYGAQFNWALDNAPIQTRWVARLDADEYYEPELVVELERRLPKLNNEVTGVLLKYKCIFMNRWIKYGGRYPTYLLRIWRNGVGRLENRWMDEHVVLNAGKTVRLDAHFCDHNLNNLTFFTEKHNQYAIREAVDVVIERRGYLTNAGNYDELQRSMSRESFRKRRIKRTLYNRTPNLLAPFLYFLFRYFLLLGFLDGRAGLIYHSLQGFWFRFLVGAQLQEFERQLRTAKNSEEFRKELEYLSGYRIPEDSIYR